MLEITRRFPRLWHSSVLTHGAPLTAQSNYHICFWIYSTVGQFVSPPIFPFSFSNLLGRFRTPMIGLVHANSLV